VVARPGAIEPSTTAFRERLCLALFPPAAVVALFGCLNLTFMAYGFKLHPDVAATSLQPGDAVPAFAARTTRGRTLTNADAAHTAGIVINFVSPDCPYCQKQLPILKAVVTQLARGPYRFVNVSAAPGGLRPGAGRHQRHADAYLPQPERGPAAAGDPLPTGRPLRHRRRGLVRDPSARQRGGHPPLQPHRARRGPQPLAADQHGRPPAGGQRRLDGKGDRVSAGPRLASGVQNAEPARSGGEEGE
jgi:thiol-disulfide isomerase/thioredoxin